MSVARKQSVGFEPLSKRIHLREPNPDLADSIAYGFSLSPLTARILAARGFQSDDRLKKYLVPSLREGLPKPSELRNLKEGAALIAEMVRSGKKIAICCDFDVDGLSGGSLVHSYLQEAGASSKVFVPDRFRDGYGLNTSMIDAAVEQGCALLLTIDFGTTNAAELEHARKLGLKTVVVDHHHVEENPPADVFINPQQEGCGFADGTLAAAGLAWYLVVGLRTELKDISPPDPKSFLDLACLGTICDMVPLHGANRVLAKRGLEQLQRTERVGLKALKSVIGVNGNLSCSHVSFGIGPRLNAAGRMLHGEVVIDLLCTKNEKLASKIAKKLHKLNKERQETEEAIKQAAIDQILTREKLPWGLVCHGEDFHTGVIGIVAQRMVERFYRPAAVLGFEEGFYKGSVRGIKGFNVVESLKELSPLLEKFGGHEGAGGFSVSENHLAEFVEGFESLCEERLRTLETSPSVLADTEASLLEVTPAVIQELKKFEPLGVGNPGPVLLLDSLTVESVKVLKDAHLKLSLSDGNRAIDAIMWRRAEHPAVFQGARVRIAGKPELNTFLGYAKPQVNLQAIELEETS